VFNGKDIEELKIARNEKIELDQDDKLLYNILNKI
jgi:hypothetical protein